MGHRTHSTDANPSGYLSRLARLLLDPEVDAQVLWISGVLGPHHGHYEGMKQVDYKDMGS